MNTGDGRVHAITGNEGLDGEQRFSSTWFFFTPSARKGCVVNTTLLPGRFSSGKETRYPLYRRLCGPQGRSGRAWKISPLPGFDSRTVQPSRVAKPTALSLPAFPKILTVKITSWR
jgi:hypothetical protein